MTSNADIFTTLTFLQSLPQIASGAQFSAFFDQANQAAAKVDALTNSVAQLEQIIGLPLSRLNTATNTSLVEAVNAAIQQTNISSVLGDITQLLTTNRTSLVAAINELETGKVNSSSISTFMAGVLSSVTTTLGLSQAIGNIPISQVTSLQPSLDSLTSAVGAKINTTDANAALAGKESLSNKNIAGGYAGLDSLTGQIPAALLPSSRSNHTYVVASQAAMLALTGSGGNPLAIQGDLAIRTDVSETFILQGSDPTILANWVQFLTPSSPVSSVAGRTGAVVLSTTDIGGLSAALAALLPLTGGSISGTLSVAGLATLGTTSSGKYIVSSSGGSSTPIGNQVTFTVTGTQLYIGDNSGSARGVTVDLNNLGGPTAWYNMWHAGNFNPSGKANTVHTHAISDITSLQTTLNGLLPLTGGTVSGDIALSRAASPGTGALFFGNSGTKYIYYDGVGNMYLQGGNVIANGGTVYSTGNLNVAGFVTQTSLNAQISGYMPIGGGTFTGSIAVNTGVCYLGTSGNYVQSSGGNFILGGPGSGQILTNAGYFATQAWANGSFGTVAGIRAIFDGIGSNIIQAKVINGPWTNIMAIASVYSINQGQVGG